MLDSLRRLFGCSHPTTIREHRADGWYWTCPACGRAGLLNPRDRERPTAIGQYDERKAASGKARAEQVWAQRQAAAARLSNPTSAHMPAKTNVLPLRRAN